MKFSVWIKLLQIFLTLFSLESFCVSWISFRVMVYRSVIESNDIGPFEKVNQNFSWILLPEPQFIRRAAPFAANQTHKSTWSKLFFSVLNCNLCELVRTSRQIVCRNSRAPQFGIASSSDVSMWGACIMIGIWDASKIWKGRSFLKKAVGDSLRGLPGTLIQKKVLWRWEEPALLNDQVWCNFLRLQTRSSHFSSNFLTRRFDKKRHR